MRFLRALPARHVGLLTGEHHGCCPVNSDRPTRAANHLKTRFYAIKIGWLDYCFDSCTVGVSGNSRPCDKSKPRAIGGRKAYGTLAVGRATEKGGIRMTSSTKRTIRLGLTVGLSLGAIVGIVGCADQSDGLSPDELAAIQSENGFTYNGMTFNGFAYNGMAYNGMSFNGMSFNGMSYNGMAYNGMAYNGMSFNGLQTSGGLSSTTGLMTTEGGRQFVEYMVKIGYPAGH